MIISWLLLLYFWGIIALQCKVEYTAEGFILKLFTLETPYMCSKTQNADFVFELSSQLLASCIRLADLTHGKSSIHKIGISLRHINLQWSCCCEHVAVICLCCCVCLFFLGIVVVIVWGGGHINTVVYYHIQSTWRKLNENLGLGYLFVYPLLKWFNFLAFLINSYIYIFTCMH